jgi:hypothetical protein
MRTYKFAHYDMDSVELKCLLVSRGVRVDKDIYRVFGKDYRINPNALTCNCMKLPDGTIVMLTDIGFHLSTISSMFSWDNLKLFKHMSDLTTPFRIAVSEGLPVLVYENEQVCRISFLPGTDFFKQKTSSGMPFLGNAVLQGCNWVAFQCLWPCEYACSGKACQYCFSGGQFEALTKRGKPLPFIPSPKDVSEVVNYAIDQAGCDSIQLTGGSTFHSADEAAYITRYLEAINEYVGRDRIKGEILLYITPPDDMNVIDRYFELGVDRIACSLEVWDDERAAIITPGKREYTGKRRHLEALAYIAGKYGKGKAFSNFIIGLEGLDTLREGAAYLSERGIIPSASVWMPFGKPVMGSIKAPDVEYFREVKEMLGALYVKHDLVPPGSCGLNVCIERDIWRYATESSC